MENKKIIKIGRNTFGISLILVGIIIIVATFCSIDVLRITLMFWPLVLIIAGCEILYFSKKDNTVIKYDLLGMILTAIVIFTSFIFSGINYFVNKVIYEDEIKNAIFESNKIKQYTTYKNYDNIKIVNKNNFNIKVNIVERNDAPLEIKISGIYKQNNYESITLIDAINCLNVNINELCEFNDKEQALYINDFVKKYDKVSIKIYIDDKDKVSMDGNFEI